MQMDNIVRIQLMQLNMDLEQYLNEKQLNWLRIKIK
jgi:hypothetical protein